MSARHALNDRRTRGRSKPAKKTRVLNHVSVANIAAPRGLATKLAASEAQRQLGHLPDARQYAEAWRYNNPSAGPFYGGGR